MLYRNFGPTNEQVSILGFGCMRLPTYDDNSSNIDEEKAAEMIHYAIDNGVNYIDTAYPYHDGASEPFVGKALQGYRDKVYLATKLPSWNIKTREDMDYYLDQQLQRLQTDYIDFYLVHTVKKSNWNNLKECGIFDFLNSALESGKIKYAGFSFHDDIDLFKEVVDSYNWSFCQIQLNYLDENYQAGVEGLKYASNKGLGVVIMEPLRGGYLVENIPQEVQQVWDKTSVKRKPAEWGLKYLWDYPEVSLVLSGMSSMEQVKENIKFTKGSSPNCLTQEERESIDKVKNIYKSKMKVNCTNCRYCMPCPQGVNIPQNFAQLNIISMLDNFDIAKRQYNAFLTDEQKASNCIECGKCEDVCPQNISIRETLKEVAETFEKDN